MKKKVISLLLLVVLILLPFTHTSMAREDEPTSHLEDVLASVVVMSGDEFLLEVSSNVSDVDVLTEMAISTLSTEVKKESSEITIKVLYCCEPNQPTRDLRFHFHVNLGNGWCETYYQDTKQCLTCTSVYPLGPKQNVVTHKTTTSCPK